MSRLLHTVFSLTTYFVLVSGVLAASFTPLGHIADGEFSNFGQDVSDNGGVVVGIDRESFRWTAKDGIEALGLLVVTHFQPSNNINNLSFWL